MSAIIEALIGVLQAFLEYDPPLWLACGFVGLFFAGFATLIGMCIYEAITGRRF